MTPRIVPCYITLFMECRLQLIYSLMNVRSPEPITRGFAGAETFFGVLCAAGASRARSFHVIFAGCRVWGLLLTIHSSVGLLCNYGSGWFRVNYSRLVVSAAMQGGSTSCLGSPRFSEVLSDLYVTTTRHLYLECRPTKNPKP